MHTNELFPQVFYSALIRTFLVLLHNLHLLSKAQIRQPSGGK